ncbi:MAG TPA: DUF2254 family protein, partial [Polyangiales bacterium]|nr:DUF2254 family protein [Polyangiales bacterium]
LIGIVAAVLAIALTVVAIIVELASNRYTHRVTELFMAEPINFAVIGLFVVTGVQSLWVTMAIDAAPGGGGIPYFSVSLTMLLLTICLLILLPYINFVFAYLNPISIVDRISAHTLDVIRAQRRRPNLEYQKREAVRGVEQLADVAVNAMDHRDKGVSMAGVNALRQLISDYQSVRPRLPPEWFNLDGELARNPDFVSLDARALTDLSDHRTWFEMKVLRQYQTVYGEALNRMRDINYVIAINTRLLAEEAARQEHLELLHLCMKFFNSYLRAAINGKDVRTAYNVFNQYRVLAQTLLAFRRGSYAVEIARYFKYYGLVAYAANLPFILETVAYDLCVLNETAFDGRAPVMDELLRIFLRVDKESESAVQEASLRGVRKAQVKLATYYLVRGDEPRARRVYEDMSAESPALLGAIRDELFAVHTAEYWEIIDRGLNFDYLPREQKRKLEVFFGWFSNLPTRPQIYASQLPAAPGGEVTSPERSGPPSTPPAE